MSYSIGATSKGVATPQVGVSMDSAMNFRTFKIAHQRVSLDIDLSRHSIKGVADIILIPLIQNLEYITLDCKNMKITNVLIENRRSENYIHDDPIKEFEKNFMNKYYDPLFENNSIEQSQFYRSKFADLSENPDERSKSQLIIKVPSSIKITLQDANYLTNYTPITPSIRGTPAAEESVFTPLSIKIEYEIQNPTTGVRFDTPSDQEPSLWNAYTANSDICSTASYWMPCVNSLDEKSTWEIEISVPRKVKDIGVNKLVGQSTTTSIEKTLPKIKIKSSNNLNSMESTSVETSQVSFKDDGKKEDNEEKLRKKKEQEEEEDDDDEDDDEDMDNENDTSNPANRDLQVCCSEFSTVKEIAHPTDLSKKLFTFQLFNPVAPHHIGWAVGAFDVWELPRLSTKEEAYEDEQEENDETKRSTKGTTNELDMPTIEADIIPIQIYTLPTSDIDQKTVLNTTMVVQKIMDFYSKEYGSYPFTSYSLAFLPTTVNPTMNFASMTICNTRLLYPPEVLDLMLPSTDYLAWSLAMQWSGVNITPLDINDIWCCLGMAGYMVFKLWEKLLGHNEFQYRLSNCNERIVSLDWEKPPIGSTFLSISRPISYTSKDLDFIKLKAPMVLYILDKRMTKTERSFGMSRILPKIFLQAMSGDLPNNSLSAPHFQYVCERVNRSKLGKFFNQWVYGSGVPIFRVTQRFNKKRMVVEMGIRQVQGQELGEGKVTGKEGFTSSVLNYFHNSTKEMTDHFTGSMTIRIHEPDGTPYEHIVEIKDVFTKLDIQYNTKYRRSRTKKQSSAKLDKENGVDNNEPVPNIHNESASNIQKFGNVLSTPAECNSWNLTNPALASEGLEIQRQNEAFEWIRIDSDFEWICKLHINQPDYMYASQLQQDADIEAQLQSIRYYVEVIEQSQISSLLYSSILTRTAMDSRYFYGVRIEACKALSKFIVKEQHGRIFPGGPRHLIKIYQKLFCYEGSNIPLNNDFENIKNYYLQKTIPSFLCEVTNEEEECPDFVKEFLLDILTYNENTGNVYNDVFLISSLIQAIVQCAIRSPQDREYTAKVLEQLHRYENLDKWTPTYQLLITRTILQAKMKMHIKGLYDFEDLTEVLMYTLSPDVFNFDGNCARFREGQEDIVLESFKILLVEGGLKNRDALQYFFETLSFTQNVYIKDKLVDIFIQAVDFVAEEKLMDTLNDDLVYLKKQLVPEYNEYDEEVNIDERIGDDEDYDHPIIQEDFGQEIALRREKKLRSHIGGVLSILRRLFEEYSPLKKIIWKTLHVPTLSLYQRKRLFDVSRILFQLVDRFEISLPKPGDKKLIAENRGNNKIVIKREGALKLVIAPKTKISIKPHTALSNDISANDSGVAPSNTARAPGATTITINTKTNSTPKLKINLQKITKPKKAKTLKPKSKKGTVNRVGILPIRFIKISTGDSKKIDLSSVPFTKNVRIIKANSRSLTVKFVLPKQEN